MPRVLAVGLILFLASCSGSRQGPDAPGLWSNGTLLHDGLQRTFRTYVPVGAPASAPLVVLLHGGKGSAEEGYKAGRREWLQIAEE
ncbi:MAG: hypothetical protein AAFQ43_14885, partial [Bacteroidota bacterium]